MTPWRKLAAAITLTATGIAATAAPVSASFPEQSFTQTACEEHTDSVARLYAAALGRDPELGGFQFWVEEYTAGNWTLPRMAQFFVESPEFQQKYGLLSDRAYVELLYRNVHRREGDAGGIDFWVAEMANGMSRATVLLRFSESPENVTNTGSVFPALGAYNEGRVDGAFSCGPDMTSYLLTTGEISFTYTIGQPLDIYRWSEDLCFADLNTPDPLVGVFHPIGVESGVEHELHHFATPLGAQRHIEGLQAMLAECGGAPWTSTTTGTTLTFHDGGEVGLGDRSIEVQMRFAGTDGSLGAINHSVIQVGNVISIVSYYGPTEQLDDRTSSIEGLIVRKLRNAGF